MNIIQYFYIVLMKEVEWLYKSEIITIISIQKGAIMEKNYIKKKHGMDEHAVATSTNRSTNCIGKCCNVLLGIQFDPVTCIKEGKVVQPSNMKTSYKLVNLILNEPITNSSKVQKILHIFDIALSIFILAHLVYSIVEFVVKQGPLGYTITCLIIFSIGSFVAFYKLAHCHSIYTHYKDV